MGEGKKGSKKQKKGKEKKKVITIEIGKKRSKGKGEEKRKQMIVQCTGEIDRQMDKPFLSQNSSTHPKI